MMNGALKGGSRGQLLIGVNFQHISILSLHFVCVLGIVILISWHSKPFLLQCAGIKPI